MTDTIIRLFEPDLTEPFEFEEDWLDRDGPFYHIMRLAREAVLAQEEAELKLREGPLDPVALATRFPWLQIEPSSAPEPRRLRRLRQTQTHHLRRERTAALRVARLEVSQARRKRQGKTRCLTPELPAAPELRSKRSFLRKIATAEQVALALR